MENNKGFATIGVIVAVLIATMIVITIFFNPILNTSVDIKNSKETIPKYINNMNGIERTYSVFKENMSHNKDISFEDINKEYTISEVDTVYSQIEITLNGSNDTFNINNKTDVNISFEVFPIDPDETHSYNIDLVLNDSNKVISKDNVVNNTVLEIPDNFLYDENTGETNYGEYRLSVDTSNCNVTIKVQYDKLDYREINIKNHNIEQILAIDNSSEENGVEIYFIQ